MHVTFPLQLIAVLVEKPLKHSCYKCVGYWTWWCSSKWCKNHPAGWFQTCAYCCQYWFSFEGRHQNCIKCPGLETFQVRVSQMPLLNGKLHIFLGFASLNLCFCVQCVAVWLKNSAVLSMVPGNESWSTGKHSCALWEQQARYWCEATKRLVKAQSMNELVKPRTYATSWMYASNWGYRLTGFWNTCCNSQLTWRNPLQLPASIC